MCVLHTFIYMTTSFNTWTLINNGQSYYFDTYRELKEFSQQLSDERAQRLEQNVRPWLSIDNRTVSQTYD